MRLQINPNKKRRERKDSHKEVDFKTEMKDELKWNAPIQDLKWCDMGGFRD